MADVWVVQEHGRLADLPTEHDLPVRARGLALDHVPHAGKVGNGQTVGPTGSNRTPSLSRPSVKPNGGPGVGVPVAALARLVGLHARIGEQLHRERDPQIQRGTGAQVVR